MISECVRYTVAAMSTGTLERHPVFRKILREKIDGLRAQGSTIAQISIACGTNVQRMHDWLSGRCEPRLANVSRLADGLSTTTDILLGRGES